MSTFFELAPLLSPLPIGITLVDETLGDAEALTQHGLAESVSARDMRKGRADTSSAAAGPDEEAMMEREQFFRVRPCVTNTAAA